MTDTILSFNKVSFGYQPDQAVLQDVTFDLHPGRIAVILGPNGAGKTTLLSLTLGWLEAWTGEIYLTGLELKTLAPFQRGRRMALVPQNEHTPFDYTVLEYVLLGRAPHLPPLGMPTEADTQIAMEILEQVGLLLLVNRPVPQLSGGERQLMLLARALIQITPASNSTRDRPRLLLLDEPTAHLDLSNKVRIIHILRKLRDQGVTILMTIHEPDVALALADDILLVEENASPQFGPLDQVFTAQALSRLYKIPIRLEQVNGHLQVLWT
jgi:iron complex transport system ATP-binding protein